MFFKSWQMQPEKKDHQEEIDLENVKELETLIERENRVEAVENDDVQNRLTRSHLHQ